MTHNSNAHPVTTLHNNTQALREQTMFAQRQAASGVERARKVSEDLAAMDLEKAFGQLRQLVALVGGKSANTTNDANDANDTVVAFPARQALSQAAQ